MRASRRIAVVSPTLDKRRGTERCVAEQLERLSRDYGYEVHLYSRRVEDVTVLSPHEMAGQDAAGRIIWHRIPSIPGPGLVKYVWWFGVNHVRRWWDATVHGARYDLLYSPGINCVDADAVSVHIVYAAYRERVGPELALRGQPLGTWPRVLHRRLYYRLVAALERRIYARAALTLAAVSSRTAADVTRRYRRERDVSVIYHAVDSERFSPRARRELRARARRELDVPSEAFALLFVGNDFRNKGLPCLLEAVDRLDGRRLWLLVVGHDERAPFDDHPRRRFLPVRPDVELYYAAADAYVGPSLEDAFGLPAIEAMASGLPVIVSSQAGVSELISDGVDGLVLKAPRDAGELAGLIRSLVDDEALRTRLGEQAVHTAQKYTWERNAAETAAFLETALRRRRP